MRFSRRSLHRISSQRDALLSAQKREQQLNALVRLHAGVQTDVTSQRAVYGSRARY